MSEKHRVFFALWPSAEIADEFHARGASLAKLHGGRLMRRETIHLTLAFVGDVSSEERDALCAIGRNLLLPRVTLSFDKVGRFRRKPLIWAGCSHTPAVLNAHVDALHAQVRAAGFSLESRGFVPHVTLLRNVPASSRHDMEAPETPNLALWSPPVVWSAQHWCLVESRPDERGANYSAVESWGDDRA